MELKPGYKQTEVGLIPEDWEVVTATEACEFVVDCKNRTPPVLIDSDYAVVRTPNVRDGKFVIENLRFTDKDSYREWTARAVPQFGDIMITREAPLGEVCAVPEGRKVCLGQRMMLYRPSPDRTDSRYLLYSLMSQPVKSNLFMKIGGSTVGHAKVDDIRFLQLPLPPISEQCAIAEALSDADVLIESLEQLITKKRQIKQGAMQELLTGKKRLPGFSGEWEVKKLGEVAEVIMGQSPSSTNYNTKGVGLPLIQGNADIVDRKTIKRVFTTEVTRKGKYGDILLSVRAPVGEISHAVFDVCLGRGVCAIRSANHFIYHYLISQEPSWGKLSKGSTFDSVNSADVKSIAIYLPVCVEEQIAIAEILMDMDVEIEGLEIKIEKAHQIKQGMMHNLLTGKIRLV
jgi:type I restriction enzyme S subunit